jgi:hypothetical protein
MNSLTSPRFWMLYRRLPKQIREAARDAHRQFRNDPTHPSLHFHRLSVDPRLWSARVTRDIRAVGHRDGNTITWFWIGNHEEFDRIFPH